MANRKITVEFDENLQIVGAVWAENPPAKHQVGEKIDIHTFEIGNDQNKKKCRMMLEMDYKAKGCKWNGVRWV